MQKVHKAIVPHKEKGMVVVPVQKETIDDYILDTV